MPEIIKVFVKLRNLSLLLFLVGASSVAAAGDNSQLSDSPRLGRVAAVPNTHIYEIQKDRSRIEFRVDSPVGDVWVSFKDFNGSFAIPDGEVEDYVTPANVDISTESMDTDSGFIRVMLESESFFDVENYPSISFTGKSFEWIDDTHAVMKGEMTIQETTQPVAFYVNLVATDADNKYPEHITVKASTTIKRSVFGIYTLLSAVGDDVNLFLNIVAVKKVEQPMMVSAR